MDTPVGTYLPATGETQIGVYGRDGSLLASAPLSVLFFPDVSDGTYISGVMVHQSDADCSMPHQMPAGLSD